MPEFHNKPGSSAHAWITDSAPESIEWQHDRSRNRFPGTPLKKCARIGRPGGRQAAGGQAGGQKPCAPLMADGPTQSEAVRGSTPPYSAVRVKASMWGVTSHDPHHNPRALSIFIRLELVNLGS